MVDELRYDAIVSDATWNALRKEYSDQQMMEAVFTAAQYQLVSMALNSLGVQLDPGLRHRLPRDLPLPPLARWATGARLSTPRIPPLGSEQWTPQQREMIAPQIRENGSALVRSTAGELLFSPGDDLIEPAVVVRSRIPEQADPPGVETRPVDPA